MAQESVTVIHDEASRRFMATIEDQEAYLSYRAQQGVLDFYYTYVEINSRIYSYTSKKFRYQK